MADPLVGRRFGRQVAVTFAVPQPDSFFGVLKNGLVVRDLRVTFEIEKTNKPDPNSATISIYNLNASSRAGTCLKPLQVRLEAGYRDSVETICLGDLVRGDTKRDGADIVTKYLIADGDRACRGARVNQSISPGTSARAQVHAIAKSMNLEVPRSVDDARGLDFAVASGGALQGSSRREMTRVLGAAGYKWSIQDGQLQILLDGQPTANEALVISQETGMIDSPEYGAPGKKGEPAKLTVKHLLYPAVGPGKKINIIAEFVNGLFVVESVKHTGDTDGGDWLSTIECTPL